MKNIFVHLGFVLILIGLSIIFVDKVSASMTNYYNDVNESNEIIELVHSNYNEFRVKSLKVKDSIVVVSKSFNIYLEEFIIVNNDISNKVKQVESEINNLSNNIDNLINYCVYDLNNEVMVNECDSFKINFNNMIKSYDEMINVYNSVITKYNDYSILNGRESIEQYSGNIDYSIKEAITKLN